MSTQAVEERLGKETSAMNENAVHQDKNIALKPRSYQLEMVEESLRRNIIVAVCTLTLHKNLYD